MGSKLKAQLGQLALFSIHIGNARATLAIKPLERHGVIASYDSTQLKGPKNATPQIACRIDRRSDAHQASELATPAPNTRDLSLAAGTSTTSEPAPIQR